MTDHDDPLAPARGIFHGIILGAAMWAPIVWWLVKR